MRCALLHGFAGDPSVWDDVLATWALPQAPIAVALPGHRRNSPVLDTWKDNLDVVAGVISRCDVVVGYSLGARVALGLVATGRIAHGVFVGVNPGIGEHEREQRRDFDARWARLLREQGIEAFDEKWTAQPLFASLPPEAAGRDDRRRNTAADLASSLRLAGTGTQEPLWDRLETLAMPVLVVAGEHDERFAAIGRRMAIAIGPNATFAVVPDAGHAAHLEQPRAFGQLLREWLALRRPGPARA